MSEIEDIVKAGAITGLKREAERLIHSLVNANWSDIKERSVYCRLGEAIDDAEAILGEMRKVLEALKELEPENQ